MSNSEKSDEKTQVMAGKKVKKAIPPSGQFSGGPLTGQGERGRGSKSRIRFSDSRRPPGDLHTDSSSGRST